MAPRELARHRVSSKLVTLGCRLCCVLHERGGEGNRDFFGVALARGVLVDCHWLEPSVWGCIPTDVRLAGVALAS